MKDDERCLERMVFLLRYLFISKFWLISFQGTEIFIARAVRGGGPLGRLGGPAWFQMVPELSQKAQVYGDVFSDRLTRFQQSPGSPNRHIVRVGAPPDSSLWRHELHHNAESAFWPPGMVGSACCCSDR